MPKPLTTKQQRWTEHLQQAQFFNGTTAEYAKAEGLSVQSLYRLRHYFNQSKASSAGEASPSFTRVVSTAANHNAVSVHSETLLIFRSSTERIGLSANLSFQILGVNSSTLLAGCSLTLCNTSVKYV